MNDKATSQWIDVKGSGGDTFSAYLSSPPKGSGPGLVLFQEIFGVNSHIRGVAEQYARDGFVVLVPDIFWRQSGRVELGYDGTDKNRAIELMKGLKADELESDVRDSVAAIRQRPEVAGRKVGALGYCLGGRLAYAAAAAGGVDAAVAYYGGGIQDQLDRASKIAVPVQFHYAGQDQSIPATAVERVREAMHGKQAEFHLYPSANHGFNCWDRATYDPASAALAHGRSLAFLAQALY